MACVIASGTSCLMKFVSYLSEFCTGFGLFHTDLDTVGSGIKPVGYIYPVSGSRNPPVERLYSPIRFKSGCPFGILK